MSSLPFPPLTCSLLADAAAKEEEDISPVGLEREDEKALSEEALQSSAPDFTKMLHEALLRDEGTAALSETRGREYFLTGIRKMEMGGRLIAAGRKLQNEGLQALALGTAGVDVGALWPFLEGLFGTNVKAEVAPSSSESESAGEASGQSETEEGAEPAKKRKKASVFKVKGLEDLNDAWVGIPDAQRPIRSSGARHSSYGCRICAKTSGNKASGGVHVRKCHSFVQLGCFCCSYSAWSPEALRKHILKEHPEAISASLGLEGVEAIELKPEVAAALLPGLPQ